MGLDDRFKEVGHGMGPEIRRTISDTDLTIGRTDARIKNRIIPLRKSVCLGPIPVLGKKPFRILMVLVIIGKKKI